jgi:hypothetical protein
VADHVGAALERQRHALSVLARRRRRAAPRLELLAAGVRLPRAGAERSGLRRRRGQPVRLLRRRCGAQPGGLLPVAGGSRSSAVAGGEPARRGRAGECGHPASSALAACRNHLGVLVPPRADLLRRHVPGAAGRSVAVPRAYACGADRPRARSRTHDRVESADGAVRGAGHGCCRRRRPGAVGPAVARAAGALGRRGRGGRGGRPARLRPVARHGLAHLRRRRTLPISRRGLVALLVVPDDRPCRASAAAARGAAGSRMPGGRDHRLVASGGP